MTKFDELKKKCGDAFTTCGDIETQYDDIMMKKVSATVAVEYAVFDVVVAILEDVVGRKINLQRGIDVRYINTDGVITKGNTKKYGNLAVVTLEFHELTKSGRVSAKIKSYIDFVYYIKTGDVMFNEEFTGTPEEVVEFIKNYKWITFK